MSQLVHFGKFDSSRSAVWAAESMSKKRGGTVMSVIKLNSYYIIKGGSEIAIYNTRKGWL